MKGKLADFVQAQAVRCDFWIVTIFLDFAGQSERRAILANSLCRMEIS